MTEVFNRSTMKERRQFLRKNMPQPEIILWSKIRRKQIADYRFRRQYSVGSYILDFYCPELKLAIEVDGESHIRTDVKEYDAQREEQIKQLGLTLLRFTNEDVTKNPNGVLQKIKETTESLRTNRAITFPLAKGKTQKGSAKDTHP